MSTFISDLYNDHWNSGRCNQRKSDSSKSAISVRLVIVEATWFEVKCNQNEKKKLTKWNEGFQLAAVKYDNQETIHAKTALFNLIKHIMDS